MPALPSSRPHGVRSPPSTISLDLPSNPHTRLRHPSYSRGSRGGSLCGHLSTHHCRRGTPGVCAGLGAFPSSSWVPAGTLALLAPGRVAPVPSGQRQGWNMSKVTSVYYPPPRGGRGRREEAGGQPFPSDALTWCPVGATDNNGDKAVVTDRSGSGPLTGQAGSLQCPHPVVSKLQKNMRVAPRLEALDEDGPEEREREGRGPHPPPPHPLAPQCSTEHRAGLLSWSNICLVPTVLWPVTQTPAQLRAPWRSGAASTLASQGRRQSQCWFEVTWGGLTQNQDAGFSFSQPRA